MKKAALLSFALLVSNFAFASPSAEYTCKGQFANGDNDIATMELQVYQGESQGLLMLQDGSQNETDAAATVHAPNPSNSFEAGFFQMLAGNLNSYLQSQNIDPSQVNVKEYVFDSATMGLDATTSDPGYAGSLVLAQDKSSGKVVAAFGSIFMASVTCEAQ